MIWIKLHRGGKPMYINAAVMQSLSAAHDGGSIFYNHGPGGDYWEVDETPEQILALLGETKVDAKIKQAAELDLVAELLDSVQSTYETGAFYRIPGLLVLLRKTLGI